MRQSRIRAPEFPPSLEWINTPEPLSLADERGKLVLLDFWTYCCINCMHVLPDLHYLEKKYADNLTVIGIHSPKFQNERVSEQVQKAINRYNINHPVANDPQLRVWREYAVRAWPTLVLIDTEGYILATLPGEGNRQHLDDLISREIARAKSSGTLEPRKSALKSIAENAETGLYFPGKILIYKNKLYVSNSGRQQILELDLDGKLLRTFGSGIPGRLDGASAQAQFNNPQGMVGVDDMLIIADTDNHCLRAIDLSSGNISTLAGNGEQGGFMPLNGAYPAPTTALNSPWALATRGNFVFIAMAGSHQIWWYDRVQQTLGLLAGTGHEDIIDGRARSSAFAQPSSLSLAEEILYVADSETSSIRKIDLSIGEVNTLIGHGLFDFGDKIGLAHEARLQHPLGVAADLNRKLLWIADTYNHKIKKLDITSHLVSDFKLDVKLNEPSDVLVQNQLLWIIDSNNHRLLQADIETGKVKELKIH